MPGTPLLLMEPLLLHKEYPLRPPRRQLLLRGERGYRFKKQLRATPGDMIRLAKSFSNFGVSNPHMTKHKLGKPMDICGPNIISSMSPLPCILSRNHSASPWPSKAKRRVIPKFHDIWISHFGYGRVGGREGGKEGGRRGREGRRVLQVRSSN